MYDAILLCACASNASSDTNIPTARFRRLQARTTLRSLLEAQARGEGAPFPRQEAKGNKEPGPPRGNTQDP